MRHKYKGRKLGTSHGHTKAMKVGLAQALFLNDRIKTTETRAKEIRGNVDRIITWAKRGDLHSRRLAIAALGNDSELVREIFEKVEQGMFKDRPGGYTRIMKLGPRKGDGARMVIMELVTESCVPKSKRASGASAAKPKTAAKKKTEPTKAEVKDAEETLKAQEAENEANEENVLERIHDSIEAFEEEFAAEVREEGEAQLAAEKKEAQAEEGVEDLKDAAREALDKKEAEEKDAAEQSPKAEAEASAEAEEVVEEQAKAEEASAEEAKAEDNAPNSADMPESEEKAK